MTQAVVAIISLYNGSKYITEAVESVLAQSVAPDEFIVVDDGSTDDGPALINGFQQSGKLTLLRKERGGQSSARNLGVNNSGSTLLAFLDQDDVWMRDHIERLRQCFIENRSVPLGWAYSDIDRIDSNGTLLETAFLVRTNRGKEHPKRTLTACLANNMMIWPSSALISRHAFERVGGFDEELQGFEDDDLWVAYSLPDSATSLSPSR